MKQSVLFTVIMMVIVIIIAFTYLLVGRFINPTHRVNNPEIIDFNQELISDFAEVKKVSTYIRRPVVYWDIIVSEDAKLDDIFKYVVHYLKSNNAYQNNIKPEFNGKVWADRIVVTFYKKSLLMKSAIRSYEGYYYITDREHSNVIDDFTHWRIFDGRYGPGSQTGEFEYAG